MAMKKVKDTDVVHLILSVYYYKHVKEKRPKIVSL